ncbi:MAG TPA: hypothetical protein VNA12_07055 [Mycobacteriales bacterium]|nr:hypothetical protein [Mycobacteriales bacterium]
MPSAATYPTADDGSTDRCAAHPGRPAHDRCPVCGLARCAADAVGGAVGCRVCGGRDPEQPTTTPVDTRALVGAAVLAHLTSVASGFVGQQYVEVRYFSLLVPAGVGILCAIAAERGAGRARGLGIRLVAAAYGVLSAGLAFRLEGSVDLFGPVGTVGPPYLAAAAGAWLWTQPPSRKRRAAQAEKQR